MNLLVLLVFCMCLLKIKAAVYAKRVIFQVDKQSHAKRTVTVTDDTIHFISHPEHYEHQSNNSQSNLLIPKIDPNCNDTVCENVENYPSELIASLLKASGQEFIVYNNLETPEQVHTRVGNNDEMPLCKALSEIDLPLGGHPAKGGLPKFIVNLDDKFRQESVREKCRDPGAKCTLLADSDDTVCRQKYMKRRFLTVSHNGKLEPDEFLVPSCCMCYMKKKFSFTL